MNNVISDIRKIIGSTIIMMAFRVIPDGEFKLRFSKFIEKNIDTL